MKLLSKPEIAKHKALEQRQAIDEGMKIATRVDRLREVQSEEEASLKRFREKTLANIHAETTIEQEKLEVVRRERKEEESKRDEARKPLDEEWSKVREEGEANRKEAERLTNWSTELEKLAQDLDSAARLLKDEGERIHGERVESSKLFQDAADDRAEAKRSSEAARKTLTEAVQLKTAVEQELAQRDASVAASERRQSIRDEAQDKRELELNARETLLSDREQTLVRNLKRNGN